MSVLRPKYMESEEAYLDMFLPADHNEQDKVCLKARYRWMMGEVSYEWVSAEYVGTSFEARGGEVAKEDIQRILDKFTAK